MYNGYGWLKDGFYGMAGVVLLGAALGCASTRPAIPAPPQAAVLNPTPAAAALVTPRPVVGKGVPYTSQEYGFQLDKPAGDSWALATNVTSPEGHSIPVVVAHPESGAQIVVQVSEPVQSPKELATMLRDKLQTEESMSLTKTEKLNIDSGGTAYGFNFNVKGEANGRVAIISVDDQIVLVVASWPENADKAIVQQIDGVVKSVRSSKNGAAKVMLRPDKA